MCWASEFLHLDASMRGILGVVLHGLFVLYIMCKGHS